MDVKLQAQNVPTDAPEGTYEFKATVVVDHQGLWSFDGSMEPAADMVQVLITIPREDRDRFQSMFPMKGAWSWFFRRALARFIALNTISLDDLIDVGMKELAGSRD